jgi:flagellar biosynthesis protein FlhB
MLSDSDEEAPQEKIPLTEQLLDKYIAAEEIRIQQRQLVQEMLFFVSCQVASASLAILLFQFAVEVAFTSWLCLFVAWMPSLNSLSEVHFNKTPEGWSLKIMNRPITAIFKFSASVAVVTFTILRVNNEIQQTEEAISRVYVEIERYESPIPATFLPSFVPQAFLASLAIVSIVAIIKSWKDKNPFGD